MTHHPIRDLDITSYQGDRDAVAFIGDGSRFSYPYFRAATREAAEARAAAWRDAVIEKHEAKFIRRQETRAQVKRAAAAKLEKSTRKSARPRASKK